jgi:hypothetical protein
MALESTQPLTEMSTRCISWGKGGRCVRLTTLPPSCAVVVKSGNLNFLEPSGPLQACNRTALPLLFYTTFTSRGIHAPGEIRTCNSRKRAAADPRLRPRGHRDRPQGIYTVQIFLYVIFMTPLNMYRFNWLQKVAAHSLKNTGLANYFINASSGLS